MNHLNRKIYLLYVVFIIVIAIDTVVFAQTFPQDFDYSRYSEVLLDAGYLWDINSTFHPLACFLQDSVRTTVLPLGAFNWMYEYMGIYSEMHQSLQNSSDKGISFFLLPGMGLSAEKGTAAQYDKLAVQPFIWSEAVFHRNWYARLYFRTTNETSSLPHYSGVVRDISRAGFNTAEIDQSVIGYRNKWAVVELGRSREIWGPMTEDNLLLAGNSPPYERLFLQFKYKRFTYRWFFGFLETVVDTNDTNINRYIVCRALEYRNRSNLVISAGEVSVLAGPNRPIDPSFLNPLALHVEVEQNDRENDQVDNHSNAILFLNIDWLLTSSLRVSGALAIDDFQLERADYSPGGDQLGYSGRLCWTPMRTPIALTFFGHWNRIDTYTMRHSYGYTNLISHSELVGHPLGNDAEEMVMGFRLVIPYSALFELSYGSRRWGENSLLYDSYSTFKKFDPLDFPSGEVRKNQYLAMRLDIQPFPNLSFSTMGHLDLYHSGEGSAMERWSFNARYQFPLTILNL